MKITIHCFYKNYAYNTSMISLDDIFTGIKNTQNFLWEKILIYLMLGVGIFLTIYWKFPQRVILKKIETQPQEVSVGINPFKLFLANLSASVGLGNLTFIAGAVLKGGPVAILWLWIGAFLGAIISYSEVFIVLKNRVRTNEGWRGGLYFLIDKSLGIIFSPLCKILLPVAFFFYTIEIYQFYCINSILANTIGYSSSVVKIAVAAFLAWMAIFISKDVKRLTDISHILIPFFLALYAVSMGTIITRSLYETGFKHAFELIKWDFSWQGIIIAAYHGLSSAMYAADIGIGQNSMVQCESAAQNPKIQARFSAMAIFTDCAVCTITCLTVLLTLSNYDNTLDEAQYMMFLFSKYLPIGKIIFFILGFLAGFTTVCSYLHSGQKLFKYFSLSYFYYISSFIMLTVSSLFQLEPLRDFMVLTGGILVIINLAVIVSLRSEVQINQ